MMGAACFVFRFPSGFRDIVRGVWQPSGSPAIAKLIEGWGARHNGTIVFIGKAPGDIPIPSLRSVAIPDFPRLQFLLLPYRRWTGVRRIDDAWNGIVQSARILRLLSRAPVQVFVCDRSNLPLGAAFAWCGTPVVVRMLGVATLHLFWARWQNAFLHPLRYAAIRAPFSAVVCSQDGSPGTETLARYAFRARERLVWFNGVERDPAPPPPRPHHGLRQIAFVGRLEPGKGVEEFIAALDQLCHAGYSGRFVAWILGEGSLRRSVEAAIGTAGLAASVEVTGAVPHAEIVRRLADADIAVSLNTLGNLSNVVLEALAAGCCTILLGGDGVRDRVTDVLLADVALRVDPRDTVHSLAATLMRCIDDRAFVQRHADAATSFAAAQIPSWTNRIAQEIELLERMSTA